MGINRHIATYNQAVSLHRQKKKNLTNPLPAPRLFLKQDYLPAPQLS